MPSSSLKIASKMFDVKIRHYGGFDTEQEKWVHNLRVFVTQLQKGFSKEGAIFYDKMGFKTFLTKARIRVPETYAYIKRVEDFEEFWKAQEDKDEFVFKPNHLSQGKWVYVLKKKGDKYINLDGEEYDKAFFKDITKKILHRYGQYRGLIMEEYVHCHPTFKEWYSYDGLADMRIYMLYDVPLYGKFRLPTLASHGYGNTGRRAAALFVNGETGMIEQSDYMNNISLTHPDTKKSFKGEKLPFWDDMRNIGISVAKLFSLPFHSVDLTVNEKGEVVVIEGEKIPLLRHYTKKGVVHFIDTAKQYSGVR